MAQLVIEVNDANAVAALMTISDQMGYLEDRIDENETRKQFVERRIRQHLRLMYKRGKRREYEAGFTPDDDSGIDP